ncbi:MAG: non-homologous end-joining DNA ligase [Gemmatimonadetes bacterium]|nr:non-homologous end-joining DNA ligase [Gemmatimonadota bacterium]
MPRNRDSAVLEFAGREVRVTNLRKPFWPDRGITKGDLLQYYADVAEVLLPHVEGRAMVMKRYPNGWRGKFFFMKRTPDHAPEWLETCAIEHGSGSVIDFPVIRHMPGLLWLVNLGCIDLNPWYSRCDDVDRPDVLHFDLDPVPDAGFDRVRETALLVKEALDGLGMPSYPKTTGSKGIHVYVPIVRGPVQKDVWRFAKAFARLMEQRRPDLVTARYRIADRPAGRVLVDYNQNAWGRTLASVYSVRPTPTAAVSAPVRWDEVERGIDIEDFRLDNMRDRVRQVGDLWRPLAWPKKGRVELDEVTRGMVSG